MNIQEAETPTTQTNPQTPSLRIAHLISNTFNPLFVAAPTFFIVAFYSAPNWPDALLWFAIPVIGISIVPILFIARAVQKGQLTDMHISIREQRVFPMLLGLACTMIVFVLLIWVHASKELLATLIALLIGGAITVGITKFWKISLHLVGIAGAVTTLTLAVSAWFLLGIPLIVLIAWARWKVGAHSAVQALAGTALACIVTAVTFWISLH